jgi:hypothetical protein
VPSSSFEAAHVRSEHETPGTCSPYSDIGRRYQRAACLLESRSHSRVLSRSGETGSVAGSVASGLSHGLSVLGTWQPKGQGPPGRCGCKPDIRVAKVGFRRKPALYDDLPAADSRPWKWPYNRPQWSEPRLSPVIMVYRDTPIAARLARHSTGSSRAKAQLDRTRPGRSWCALARPPKARPPPAHMSQAAAAQSHLVSLMLGSVRHSLAIGS